MWQDSEIVEIDENEFKQLYMTKEYTVAKLCEYYGVKPSQIVKIAKELGLSKRRPTRILKVIKHEN